MKYCPWSAGQDSLSTFRLVIEICLHKLTKCVRGITTKQAEIASRINVKCNVNDSCITTLIFSCLCMADNQPPHYLQLQKGSTILWFYLSYLIYKWNLFEEVLLVCNAVMFIVLHDTSVKFVWTNTELRG